MKFTFSALGLELMALHEAWLQENFLSVSQPQESKPLTIEEFHQKHEASLSIGLDKEAGTYYAKSHPNIAIIPVIGQTSKFGGWSSMGTMFLSALLANAKNSGKYKAALIYVDSPGGAVDGMQDWADEIRNAGIPTLAFIDGLGASGGYWQAISADRVLANSINNNLIGSIGVMTMHVDKREVAKTTIGDVKILRARQSTLKIKINSFEPLTKEAENWVIDRLSETADLFIDYVNERRPGLDAKSTALAGEVFNGAQALEEGLIDGLATYQEAIEELAARIAPTATLKSNSKSQNQSLTNNSNTMKFKMSWASILGAIGFGAVASEDEAPAVTEERLEQLNGSLTTAHSTISDLKSQVTKLQGDLTAAQTAQTMTETDRDAWKTKAEQYAKGPGASHFVPNAGKTEGGNQELSAEEQAAATIASLPHNVALNGNPMFNNPTPQK
jgi:ClpP class serine protease